MYKKEKTMALNDIKVCPNCDNTVASDKRICMYCGYEFSDADQRTSNEPAGVSISKDENGENSIENNDEKSGGSASAAFSSMGEEFASINTYEGYNNQLKRKNDKKKNSLVPVIAVVVAVVLIVIVVVLGGILVLLGNSTGKTSSSVAKSTTSSSAAADAGDVTEEQPDADTSAAKDSTTSSSEVVSVDEPKNVEEIIASLGMSPKEKFEEVKTDGEQFDFNTQNVGDDNEKFKEFRILILKTAAEFGKMENTKSKEKTFSNDDDIFDISIKGDNRYDVNDACLISVKDDYLVISTHLIYPAQYSGKIELLMKEAEVGGYHYVPIFARFIDGEKYDISSVDVTSGSGTKNNLTDSQLFYTSWKETESGLGVGESITIHLSGKKAVSGIYLVNGDGSSGESSYFGGGRVSEVEVDFGDGNVVTKEFSTDEFKYRYVSAERYVNTDRIVITIKNAESGNGKNKMDTAISDLGVY